MSRRPEAQHTHERARDARQLARRVASVAGGLEVGDPRGRHPGVRLAVERAEQSTGHARDGVAVATIADGSDDAFSGLVRVEGHAAQGARYGLDARDTVEAYQAVLDAVDEIGLGAAGGETVAQRLQLGLHPSRLRKRGEFLEQRDDAEARHLRATKARDGQRLAERRVDGLRVR